MSTRMNAYVIISSRVPYGDDTRIEHLYLDKTLAEAHLSDLQEAERRDNRLGRKTYSTLRAFELVTVPVEEGV